MKTKNCLKCGAQNKEENEKCEKCGGELQTSSGLNWKILGCVFGGIAIFLILIIAVSGCGKNNKSNQKQTSTPTPTIKYVFDIPALVGKNIDEIRTILGEPNDSRKEPTPEQLSIGIDQWSNAYKKEEKDLLITFNPKSRKIIDFFIASDDPSGQTQDKAHLLELGNLKENDPNYKIEFVKVIKDPNYYT